jgi:hypothetical protein
MPTDPMLESLIAAGHYAIAADRYEEQTGDAELAALMRIDGLEWELVNGVPALRMKAEHIDFNDRFFWWRLHCGRYDFGTVDDNYGLDPPDADDLPRSLNDTPITAILDVAGLPENLTERLYRLYREAVARECK